MRSIDLTQLHYLNRRALLLKYGMTQGVAEPQLPPVMDYKLTVSDVKYEPIDHSTSVNNGQYRQNDSMPERQGLGGTENNSSNFTVGHEDQNNTVSPEIGGASEKKTSSPFFPKDEPQATKQASNEQKKGGLHTAEGVHNDIFHDVNHDYDHEKNKAPHSEKLSNLMRGLLYALLGVLMLMVLAASAYMLYRWATETPITIQKTVVEEKIETPEECTQVRRNGKIYMSCDGVKIDGADSIEQSGVKDVPELLE